MFSSSGVSYQWWSVDSGIITGATNYYYSPTQDGNYFVIVTDTVGCSGASNTIITAIAPLSFGEELRVRIAPNPNNGSFQIIFNDDHGIKNAQLKIINSFGAEVFKSKNKFSSGQVITTGLTNGIYSLIIVTDKGIATKRFEVMN